ncbi:hypothetical protein M404DRAFT_76202, partial [Pisolithus tinctorius Marx 270]
LHPFIDGWVPALAINAWCNNDVKLLTNSRATTNLSFYITTYQTKNKVNITTSYHKACTPYLEDICNQQHLLLFCLVHAINQEQELATLMVMSYLMGWGDTYHLHHYMPIYWSSF